MYVEKNVAVTIVHFCYDGYTWNPFKKRTNLLLYNHFLLPLKLYSCSEIKNTVKGNMRIQKKLLTY